MEIVKQSIILDKIEDSLNNDLKLIEELREMARVREPETCLSPKSWMSLTEAEFSIKEALFSIKRSRIEAGNERDGLVLNINPPYGEGKKSMVVNPPYGEGKPVVNPPYGEGKKSMAVNPPYGESAKKVG